MESPRKRQPKFLSPLPSAWSQISLIMRTKPGVEQAQVLIRNQSLINEQKRTMLLDWLTTILGSDTESEQLMMPSIEIQHIRQALKERYEAQLVAPSTKSTLRIALQFPPPMIGFSYMPSGPAVKLTVSSLHIRPQSNLNQVNLKLIALPDENQVLLRVPRQNNMYSFNLENIVPSGGLACLIAKVTVDESNKWHRRRNAKLCHMTHNKDLLLQLVLSQSSGWELSYTDLTNSDQDDSQIPALEDSYDNPNDSNLTKASLYDRQEEGIDNDEVFAPVARIESIRIFLPLLPYMGFHNPKCPKKVYQSCESSLWFTPILQSQVSDNSKDLPSKCYEEGISLRKHTTGVVNFLGRRLIFMQCKKADNCGYINYEAEYVAAGR
ncbi:hypothetical protein Tco_0845671 [Tanacetum coccineum]